MSKRRPPKFAFTILALLAVGAMWLGGRLGLWEPASESGTPVAVDDASLPETEGSASKEGGVLALYEAAKSDVVLTTAGRVVKVLPDDTEGHQHQKFLIEVPGDVTVLVAHNIDIAPRVPLSEGDLIRLRGEYEWTAKGGTLHWTHRTERGSHEHGWVEHNGVRYE